MYHTSLRIDMYNVDCDIANYLEVGLDGEGTL